MFIYNEYSKLCFALVLYLSSSLQLIQNYKKKMPIFINIYGDVTCTKIFGQEGTFF